MNTVEIPSEGLTRQERLLLFMRRSNLKYVDLAKELGWPVMTLRNILASSMAITYRVDALRAMGKIPEELLPPPGTLPELKNEKKRLREEAANQFLPLSDADSQHCER